MKTPKWLSFVALVTMRVNNSSDDDVDDDKKLNRREA